MADSRRAKVIELIEAPLAQHGYELADLIVAPFRNRATVRVFVYREGGVSLGDCSLVSRTVGELLETTELFQAGYTLEVSSPGLDRPLTTPRDFRFRTGEVVEIRFVDQSRKPTIGKIMPHDDLFGEAVRFRQNDQDFIVPLAEISQARIQLEG